MGVEDAYRSDNFILCAILGEVVGVVAWWRHINTLTTCAESLHVAFSLTLVLSRTYIETNLVKSSEAACTRKQPQTLLEFCRIACRQFYAWQTSVHILFSCTSACQEKTFEARMACTCCVRSQEQTYHICSRKPFARIGDNTQYYRFYSSHNCGKIVCLNDNTNHNNGHRRTPPTENARANGVDNENKYI